MHRKPILWVCTNRDEKAGVRCRRTSGINPRFPKNNEIDLKPSRTERAISATNERNKRDNNNINSADNQAEQKFGLKDQKNEKKGITSDGIEALKPFEI